MKRGLLFLACGLILAMACSLSTSAPADPTPIVTPTDRPGYFQGQTIDPVAPDPEPTEIISQPPDLSRQAPLFITTMTHMEGNHDDDRSEDLFQQRVASLRYGMSLFDEYGAKLTIESEQPFARANYIWDHNMLQEVVDSGHGVGTHCDFDPRADALPAAEFAALFAANKALVDGLVGAENNRGCSGAGGFSDWGTAAIMAGFDYINGIVALHYLPMPLENRPDETWTDQFILRAEIFHENAPIDLAQRIHPIMISDGLDFVADDEGTLLLTTGEIGRLDTMAEPAGQRCNNDKCPVTAEDVDLLMQEILLAASHHNGQDVGKINIYLPVNIFDEANEAGLRLFLERVAELEVEGILQWATQGEVYDAYREWHALTTPSNATTATVTAAIDLTVPEGLAEPAIAPPAGQSNNQSGTRVANPGIVIPASSSEYLVTNPTSGAELYTLVLQGERYAGQSLPALVLVPGATGSSLDLLKPPNQYAYAFANAGYTVVLFDPDGRGQSTGIEDHNGYSHQDGLAAVIEFAAGLPEVDANQMGLITFSYGVTMGSGTLARHSDLPIDWFIDWEGPADRLDTGGCGAEAIGHLQQAASCDDETFWAEREALIFISELNVPYLRLQSESDHVQPDNEHALAMINAAISGGNQWVRLNDLPANITFPADNPPALMAESLDRQLATVILEAVQELWALFD